MLTQKCAQLINDKALEVRHLRMLRNLLAILNNSKITCMHVHKS